MTADETCYDYARLKIYIGWLHIYLLLKIYQVCQYSTQFFGRPVMPKVILA